MTLLLSVCLSASAVVSLALLSSCVRCAQCVGACARACVCVCVCVCGCVRACVGKCAMRSGIKVTETEREIQKVYGLQVLKTFNNF